MGRQQAAAGEARSRLISGAGRKSAFSFCMPFLKKHHPAESSTASEICWPTWEQYTNWWFVVSIKTKQTLFVLNQDRYSLLWHSRWPFLDIPGPPKSNHKTKELRASFFFFFLKTDIFNTSFSPPCRILNIDVLMHVLRQPMASWCVGICNWLRRQPPACTWNL